MDGDPARRSYLKTTGIALIAMVVLLLLLAAAWLVLAGPAGALVVGVLGVGVFLLLVSVAGGVVVLWRDHRARMGNRDLFLECNQSRSEAPLQSPDRFRASRVRRWFARLFLGHSFLPGDEVEIRPLEEILSTLDTNGMCGGMPFQAEMLRHCGKKGHVFRSVDKIYDYGRKKDLRLLRNCVLLAGLRCGGEFHGECQANCYLMWHVSWIRRPACEAGARAAKSAPPAIDGQKVEWLKSTGKRTSELYSCQYTALHWASTPLSPWSVAKDLRPLVAGNVTFRAFLVAVLTRLFDRLQHARGGVGFPRSPGMQIVTEAPPVAAHAEVGSMVRVRSPEEIGRTLDGKSRNLGLWFDRDMLKHCGTVHRVGSRVDRIIDDATGRMLQMKTPCIVLDGVYFSGEAFSMSAQHDPFFWREAWIEPVAGTDSPANNR